MARKNDKNLVVADICLYGTSRIGAGFIVCRLDNGKMAGDGESVAGRSFTEATWMGIESLRTLGVEAGLVRIFEPGGDRMAIVDINRVPSYGNLQWGPAPIYTLSVRA